MSETLRSLPHRGETLGDWALMPAATAVGVLHLLSPADIEVTEQQQEEQRAQAQQRAAAAQTQREQEARREEEFSQLNHFGESIAGNQQLIDRTYVKTYT